MGFQVVASYTVEDADLLMSGNVVMAKWNFGTRNAVASGAEYECSFQGMLRCSFTEQNKVSSCEFMFDVMSFMQQLQYVASPSPRAAIVANTLQMALGASDEARVITAAHAPFPIIYVNGPWSQLCGYSQDECVGQNLSILQGPATDRHEVAHFMRDVWAGRSSSMTVTNYCKTGRPFNVQPLGEGQGHMAIVSVD